MKIKALIGDANTVRWL